MDAGLQLFRYDDLFDIGLSERGIRSHVAGGSLVRLRPGVFVRGAEWKLAKPEKRIVARARALAAISATRPVFSHETAAALHGLPLYSANW